MQNQAGMCAPDALHCRNAPRSVTSWPGRVGPVQSGAFVRFTVDWLALPAGGGEEESDARLAFGVAAMNDMAGPGMQT
jgi:hypothetical protein